MLTAPEPPVFTLRRVAHETVCVGVIVLMGRKDHRSRRFGVSRFMVVARMIVSGMVIVPVVRRGLFATAGGQNQHER
jgi:hypothetical protein